MWSCLLALVIPLQPLVSDSVLEPSIRNEVDHALSRAPSNVVNAVFSLIDFNKQKHLSTNCTEKACIRCNADIFGTNSLSATEIAIKLVSSQKPDGRWMLGTNDVTVIAVKILKSL